MYLGNVMGVRKDYDRTSLLVLWMYQTQHHYF